MLLYMHKVYFCSVKRSSTIVDMGAGEAVLHLRLHNAGFEVLHSFDLVAVNERVTVANMNKARERRFCGNNKRCFIDTAAFK